MSDSFKEYLKDTGVKSERTRDKYSLVANSFIKFAKMTTEEDLKRTDLVDKAIEFCNNRFRREKDNEGNMTFVKIEGDNRSYIQKYAIVKWFEFHKLDNLVIEFKKKTKRTLKQRPRLKLEKALNMTEWKKLVSKLPEEYSMIVKLMFWGGFRIEETLKICRSDLKPFGNQIRVSTLGKGDKQLSVFMPEEFSKELLIYVNKKCKGKKNAKLFDISYNQFRKEIKVFGKDILDDETITSHAIGKHTRGQFEFESGTPIQKIKEILWHQNISTTDIYRTQGAFDSKSENNEREKRLKTT